MNNFESPSYQKNNNIILEYRNGFNELLDRKNSFNSEKGKGPAILTQSSQQNQSELNFIFSPSSASKERIKVMRFLTENKETENKNKKILFY